MRYTVRHKFFNNQAEDDLMVLFVRDLVRHRLDRRLRDEIGGAAYGLEVSTTQRGPVGFLEIEISVADLAKHMIAGENHIAVHCHQTGGGQFIDVGIVAIEERPRK